MGSTWGQHGVDTGIGFVVVLGGSWWFLVVPGGFLWFLVVLGGSLFS